MCATIKISNRKGEIHMKMRRLKIVAVLLVIAMLAGPVAVFADDAGFDSMTNREIVAFVVQDVFEEFTSELEFDPADALAEADLTQDDFVDMLYNIFTGDDIDLADYVEPMRDLIESYAFMMWFGQINSVIAQFASLGLEALLYEAFGDADLVLDFLDLDILFAVADAIGFDRLVATIYQNPHLADVLRWHGADILDALDFSLFEAVRDYFVSGAQSPGLAILDEVLNGLVTREVREIFFELLQLGNFLDMLLDAIPIEEFDSAIIEVFLTADDVEQRKSLDFQAAAGLFDIYFYDIDGAKLNLFFHNQGDAYVVAFVEFEERDSIQWHVIPHLVAPVQSVTLQLSLATMFPDLPIMINTLSIDGGDVVGEFALRKTFLPL